MQKQYSFTTNWRIEAPVEKVWEAIYQSEEWPDWWTSIRSVKEIRKGNEKGIGGIQNFSLVSPMKYQLKFQLLLTEREDCRLLKGIVSGDLKGVGSWHFAEKEGITQAVCKWEVATTVGWMNWLSFLLAPVFSYNHKLVMDNGAKCLARKLNARLLSY